MSETIENGTPVETPAPAAWYESLQLAPEDVGYIQNKGWQESPAKLFESYKQLEKFQGAPPDQILKLPKADDAEGWSKVYNKLGRPETPDGYGEFKVENPDWKIDSERVKWADKVFHDVGLTKAQRDAIITNTSKYEFEALSKQHQTVVEQSEAELATLKGEWGSRFEERVVLAKRAAKNFLPANVDRDAMLDKIESAVGTSTMLKMFANMGERMGEDRTPMGDTKETPFGYTKEQAKADLATLKAEVLNDPNRARLWAQGKGADYERIERLNKILAGG